MLKTLLYTFFTAIISINLCQAKQLVYKLDFAPMSLEENQQKPIIYVFKSNDICYSCPQSIDLIENIYKRYYTSFADLKIINYKSEHDINYAGIYNLSQPLEIILIKKDQKKYTKLLNVEDKIDNPMEFTTFFQEKIDVFLGINTRQ